jgi:hypothetical protein
MEIVIILVIKILSWFSCKVGEGMTEAGLQNVSLLCCTTKDYHHNVVCNEANNTMTGS